MEESVISYPGSLLFELASRPAEQRLGLILGVKREHFESAITDAREEKVTHRNVLHVLAFRSVPAKVWESASSKEKVGTAIGEWIASLLGELGMEQVILGIYLVSGAPEVLSYPIFFASFSEVYEFKIL